MLRAMVDMREAQNVKCPATLAGFDHPEGWCYIGCTNDQTKLKQIWNRFKCENCNLWFDEPTYCFRLAAFITDETVQEVDIILFDKQAQTLCGYSATELVMQPDTSRHEVPYDFAPAVGQKYSFVLKYNRGTEQKKRPTFNVNDIMPITTVSSRQRITYKALSLRQQQDVWLAQLQLNHQVLNRVCHQRHR